MKIPHFSVVLVHKCVEKTDNWVLVIEYSDCHYVATCEFWNQEYLDKDFNKNLQVLNEIERYWDERIFREHLEVRGDNNDTLYYVD